MSIPFTHMDRAPLVSAALFLLVLAGSLAAQETKAPAGNVPGVDAVPAAAYPAGDPRGAEAEQAATETSRVQETDAADTVATNNSGASKEQAAPTARDAEAADIRSRFPLIRNLRVEPDREFPHSVRIRWDVDPANDTAIYVGRYIRPLATRELILEAENLTSPPLGPRSTSYIDRNIPDGAYYYVVVTTFEMSKRGTVVLQPNVNYTTTPSVIYRDGRDISDPRPNTGEETGDAPGVTNLFAVNSDDGVKLSWRPPARSGLRYNIYRGESPLDSPAALRSATRLAVVQGRQYIYEDRSALPERPVYYGVTVTDTATDREEQKLYPGRSFIPHTYRKPTEANESATQTGELPDA
ncbi:MAG: hypothetical protein RIF32_00245, partial [Leptospirales bacterium]